MKPIASLFRERFPEPTAIQKKAMPLLLQGKNALLVAPTGSGKCVSGDTIILTNEGPVKIEDLYQKTIEVNSLGPKLRVEFSKGIVIRKRKSGLFKVTTESGREVKATDDHKFLVLKDGILGWEMLKNLKKGDYIGCARRMAITENPDQHISLEMLTNCGGRACVKTEPSIQELINSIKKKRGRFGLRRIARLVGRHRATLMHAKKNYNMQISTYLKLAELSGYCPQDIKITEIGGPGCKAIKLQEINEDLAYFAGLFAGDGNYNRKNIVRFSTASPELLSFFKGFCGRLGLDVKKDASRKYDYYVCSRALYVILNSLGIEDEYKSSKIRIPPVFFRKPSLLAAFIRGLFDTDGSITNEIEYCTKSKQMAKEVQLALLCFGVLSRLRTRRHKKYGIYYRIFIPDSENISTFVSSIGFGHPEKLSKAKKFLAKARNPNKDIIPNIARLVKIHKEKLGIPYQRLHANRFIESYMYGSRNPTRRGLERLLNSFPDLGDTKESSLLRQLSASDIFWDKITEIIGAGEDYVYDATVPGNSNFIGNGIILHNTEAALLPVLEMVHGKPGISCLYITPLRALNRDMKRRMDWWCEHAGITHGVRHGDTGVAERGRQRKEPPQLLITTPETLQALLVGRVMRKHLSNVKYVIVDEVHELLNNKRGTQLSMGLERLAEVAEFQRIGLSATVAKPREAGKLICGGRAFEVVEAGRSREMDLEIIKSYGGEKKAFEKLKEVLAEEKRRRIVFVNTRSTAEALTAYLHMEEVPIDVHHGSLSAEVRLKTEEGLKGGELETVVATSSLELGIDIGDMEEIVQFGSPREVSRLVQRVGRSGHALHLRPSGKIIAGDYDDWMESRAIERKFTEGFLEEREVVRGALDVAAHQFVGLLLDKGRMNIDEAYKILDRAYAFGLKPEAFQRAVKQLGRERLIFLNPDNTAAIRQAGREYYFYNLTTIPKEKKYLLRDASTNRIVASLDERFVASLAPGEFFSAKGKVWRMVELSSELLAEPASSADFVIPDWVGEDIPVHREVAQEVGRLRKEDGELHGCRTMPDEKRVLVEISRESVVVHSCFGTRINYTLGRVLQLRLAKKLGAEVAVATDPYRIMLKLPFPARKEWIDAALVPYDLEFDAEESLWNTSALRIVFLHTGRMFGMFGEDAIVGTKLIRLMVDTPVYEETLNSIFRRHFDLDGAKRVLLGIMKKELGLVFEEREKLSFFAMEGIRRKEEGVPSIQPREAMLKSIRGELGKKRARLKCLSCGAERVTTVANAPEDFNCHKCGMTSVAVWPGSPEDLALSAAILRSYGKRGLLALSVFGVGPKTADRILRKLHRDDDELLLDLLEAQKNFIKNKRYWKA